jgi:hypothetical protein
MSEQPNTALDAPTRRRHTEAILLILTLLAAGLLAPQQPVDQIAQGHGRQNRFLEISRPSFARKPERSLLGSTRGTASPRSRR